MATRPSNGLAQFCATLEERPGLAILDFARASQSTVSFVTNYGHRLYSEDFLVQLEHSFSAEALEPPLSETVSRDPLQNQSNPLLVSHFFESALNFTDGSFDGALIWDSLEFVSPPLLQAVVNKLHRILQPGSSLLAIFHGADPVATVETRGFRIHDSRTLDLAPGIARRPAQMFNNRGIEKLFQDFASVKFFLTRDHLREVLVKR